MTPVWLTPLALLALVALDVCLWIRRQRKDSAPDTSRARPHPLFPDLSVEWLTRIDRLVRKGASRGA